MWKDLPSLAVLVPEAVTCENNFSGMSDSGDDMPALQSDKEEEEEEPAKFKIKVKFYQFNKFILHHYPKIISCWRLE